MTFNPLITTAFYKRHHILDLWLEGTQRHGYDILLVGSDGPYSRMKAERAGCHYLEVPNKPLQDKLQSRVEWFLSRPEYTHVIFLGSDDILCPKAMKVLKKNALAGHGIIAWRDMYFYDVDTDSYWYFGGYEDERKGEPAGPGKCFSRAMIEKYTPLWDGTTSPDRSVWNKIKRSRDKIILSCKEKKCYLTGIKSEFNLTPLPRMIRAGRIKQIEKLKAI